MSQKLELAGGDGSDNEDLLNDPELLMNHPLKNKWAFWFFKNDKTKDWEECLQYITAFDTVEDFWCLYEHVQMVSKLPFGCDYSLFKDGVEPAWDDKMNKRGGRWLIKLEKQQRQSDLDNFWLEMLLCLIGEAFGEHGDNICGAAVNIRPKGDILSLWTRDASRIDSTMKIGIKLKERLLIPQSVMIYFQSHQDMMVTFASTQKNRYTV